MMLKPFFRKIKYPIGKTERNSCGGQRTLAFPNRTEIVWSMGASTAMDLRLCLYHLFPASRTRILLGKTQALSPNPLAGSAPHHQALVRRLGLSRSVFLRRGLQKRTDPSVQCQPTDERTDWQKPTFRQLLGRRLQLLVG